MLVSEPWSVVILFSILLGSMKWFRKQIVRRYEYLVVYKGIKRNKLTDGMLVIEANGKIKGFRYLKEIQEHIKTGEDLEKVIITNYKLLKKGWERNERTKV